MGWKEFIASIVSSLAWPIVSVIFFIMFRSELSKLVQRIIKIKTKNLEAQFSELDKHRPKLHEEVKRIPSEHPKVLHKHEEKETAEDYDFSYEELLLAAEANPPLAILQAWQMVELAIMDAVRGLFLHTNQRSMCQH